MFWEHNTMINCDKKIIKLYIPNSHLLRSGARAASINIKLAGSNCCKQSNVVTVAIPATIPSPPISDPDKCLENGIDLIGYIAKVSYDPTKCPKGNPVNNHQCDGAVFDLYLNNILVGQANLNNGSTGGYRETLFTIKQSVIAKPGLILELRCALRGGCHKGIGRIDIYDPNSNNLVYGACIPNDVVVNDKILCP